jgi:hypothetical protein
MPPDCDKCRARFAGEARQDKETNNGGGIMDDKPITVPYIVHEAEMARMERTNKRWFIAWLVTFVLLVGCVAGFIWYESQFEDIVITAEQQADGDSNNYAVGGDFYGFETESNDKAPNP